MGPIYGRHWLAFVVSYTTCGPSDVASLGVQSVQTRGGCLPVIYLALRAFCRSSADTRWKAVGLVAVSNTVRPHARGCTLTFLRVA